MTRNFQPVSSPPVHDKPKKKSSKKSHRHERLKLLSWLTKSVCFLIYESVVLLLACMAAVMAQFNNRYSLFDAANDVEALGSQHIYTAWDLSCYGTWGYRQNCFKLKSTWEEFHCRKRKDMMIAGATFLYAGAACIIAVIVLMILGKLKIIKLPRVTFLLVCCPVVGFLISWAVFLGLYNSNTCTSVQESKEDYPLKNYTKIGPGFFMIIFVFVLQIGAVLLFFTWWKKLWCF